MVGHKITHIVHLGCVISTVAEREPDLAYDVNCNGTKNVLDMARDHGCSIFMATSMAVFGGSGYPKIMTPVDTSLKPETIYGVTKVFNE